MQRMGEIYFQVDWKKCPRGCGREAMKLYDETQCWDCFNEERRIAESQRKLGEYLRKTIGPYGIERYAFGNFETSPNNSLAFENACAFDHRRDSLLLMGPCGTGKTHLAGAILKKCAAENIEAVWANPIWLARQFRMRTREEEEALLHRYATVPVFIVDDLGVGKDTEFSLGKLYEIIGYRINDKRFGAVLTSNLSLDDMQKKFGDDRLTSRLSGHCRVYEVGGPDMRLRMAMAQGQYEWRRR